MIIDYKEGLFLEDNIINSINVNTDTEGLYVADFETSNVNEVDNDVFVYATALMDVYDDLNRCYHTNNIKDFIQSISNLPYLESKIYFHNLSFDTVFALIELFDKGFEQIRNKYKERFDGGLNFISSKKTKKISLETARPKKDDEEIYQIRPFSYNIVFNNGSFYRVDLYFNYETYKDKRGKKKTKIRKVSLLDSYKIVPMALKTVSKDFLSYDMPKDGIDHTIIRPQNYKLKREEKIYLYEDVRVLKEFINLATIEGVHVTNDYRVHFNKMTTASQALNEYKTILFDLFESNTYKKSQAFKEGFEEVIKYSENQYKLGRKYPLTKDNLFLGVFPLLHPNVDCFLRQSYFGGITWKNEKLLNKLQSDGTQLKGLVYDVNSLYPSVMRNKLLPYGKPIYYEGFYNTVPSFIRKDYPLYIQKIRVPLFEIKPNKLPNIQIRESNIFKSTEYQESNKYFCEHLQKERFEECVFTFTNVQLERFLDTYDLPLGIEYIEGYMFKGSLGIFDDYIDTFMELKKTGEGARKSTAKLMLNSLYGKFGTNPQREERIIQFDDGVFSTTNKDEQGNLLEYLSDGVYLPLASFITSYARDVLLESANNVYDRFMYCDTDSIHILGYEVPNIRVHDKELGAWKLEGKFISAKYIGAKRYAEKLIIIKDSKYFKNVKHYKIDWGIKCCGVSTDVMSKLDDIEVFECCEYSPKEIKHLLPTFYTKDDIYYYKDKECKEKVKGLLRSKKKMYVKGGILIKEQPYAITDKTFIFGR